MREIIRAAAVASVLGLSACVAHPAFAQVPEATEAPPCVPMALAVERLEAAGITVLGLSHAPFTGNELLFLKRGDLVVATTVVKNCVVGDILIIGAFKAEFGI